jgi:hypothetical protein
MFTTWPRRLILVAIFLGILGLFGLRVTHPHYGLDNSLGSARSSVAIYWAGHDYQAGTDIIYASDDPKENPALGVIKNVDQKTYDVQNPQFLEMVKKEHVEGHLLILIPFIGWPLHLIGF